MQSEEVTHALQETGPISQTDVGRIQQIVNDEVERLVKTKSLPGRDKKLSHLSAPVVAAIVGVIGTLFVAVFSGSFTYFQERQTEKQAAADKKLALLSSFNTDFMTAVTLQERLG